MACRRSSKALDYLADDTLEGLAGQLGLTGDAVTNFIEQIGTVQRVLRDWGR